MKTRLFSFLMILMLSVSFAMAQGTGSPKLSCGVLAGINFQNINGKDGNGDKLSNDMIVGFHAGANALIPIVPEFFFQPGLLFSTKGAKHKYSLLGTSYTDTYNLTYLEVPLNFVYKGSLGGGFVMVGFGPYVAYGIGGKVKTKGGSSSQDRKIKFKNVVETGDDLTVPYSRAFDAGANIFAGYEMASGLFAQLNTQFGMLKINSEYKIFPDDKTSEKNTGFGISIGYRF
jgi:hypothetical protein